MKNTLQAFLSYFELCYAPKSWEFGVGFNLPSKSQNFSMITKIQHFFNILIFVGPITLCIGKPAYVFAFKCPSCDCEQERKRTMLVCCVCGFNLDAASGDIIAHFSE